MQRSCSVLVLVILFVVAVVGGRVYQQGSGDVMTLVNALTDSSIDGEWPPTAGNPYPDIELTDTEGRTKRLSEFAGQVLIVEPVGISCPACQAFAGGHQVGGYRGIGPQPGLQSFREYFDRFAGDVSLSDPGVRVVQILFYGSDGAGAPTLDEAREWARHFAPRATPNTTVLFGDQRYINGDTYQLVPGFHLIDHQFVLRCDAGKPPRQNLYTELIPMVSQLLDEMDR